MFLSCMDKVSKTHPPQCFPAFFHRISEYMDLTPAEVVGHTCYHFIHVEDLENFRQSHEDCESHPYAYLIKAIQFHPLLFSASELWSKGSLSRSLRVKCDRRPLLQKF